MQTNLIFAVAALGGLLFGYDTGVISGALLFLRDIYKLTPTMQGIVVGVALVGAVAGAVVAGTLSDRFGRRWVLFWTAILFVLGAIGSALVPTSSIVWLLIARVLVGVAIGLASMLTPLYLAELATAERRGGVVSLNQLCITVGILVSYLVDSALASTPDGWRWMLGLGAVPGVVLAIGMLVLPESPRWLAGHGRGDEAEAVLRQVRGPGTDVQAELASLRSDLVVEGKRTPWSALLLPALRRPLIIGVGLAIFQQITGINTVIYFAPQIFEASGLTGATASILATAGVGVVNVLLTIASIWLIDRAGRRPLLLWSLGGMAVSLAVLALGFWLGASGPLGLLTAVSLAAYVAFFAIGLGPVFWLLISEIFPLGVRGRAMSVATIANWGFNLLVTVTFLRLIHAVGRPGTFLLYAVLTLAGLIFTYALVPETKGRSLEEIEATFAVPRETAAV